MKTIVSSAIGKIAVTLIALLAVCSSLHAACYGPPSGLVGWWKGDGNANDVAGANNGTLSATGVSYVAGEVGMAFHFDGTNGYMAIPDAPALKPAAVTLEAWVRLDPGASIDPTDPGEVIIFKRNSWTYFFEGYAFAKYPVSNGNGTNSDRFQFVITRNGTQSILTSTTVVQRGVWYHVAATYDGTTSILFINGVAEATASPGFALDYGTLPVYIGTTGEPYPYRAMFAGAIDEPSIYSRALTTNEIAAIFAAGSAGKCSFTVASTCTPPAAGLVSWWKGESNATDVNGSNNGTLSATGVSYASGEVGQAFNFTQTNGLVRMAASSSLDLGASSGFTLETWINPTDVSQSHPIFEWNDGTYWGVHFFIEPGQPFNSNPGPGELYANIPDSSGFWHQLSSPGGVVLSNVFQHVALTYDQASGTATIYRNGQVVGQQNIGSFTPRTQGRDLYLGRRIAPSAEDTTFTGLIDEPSIYSRALSSNEIAAIYNAGSAGKCVPISVSTGVPAIAGFIPQAATNSSIISITGTNFSPVASQNIVRFGAVKANVIYATPNVLTLTVPAGATLGPITVTVNGLTAYSRQYFQPTFVGTNSNLSTSSFAPGFTMNMGGSPQSCLIGDLDGDGKPDIAATSSDAHCLTIFRNLSTPGTALNAASFAPGVNLNFPTNGISGAPYRVRAADLDGDGKLDLIAEEISGNRVSIFHNVSTPGSLTTNSFEPSFALISGNDCRFAAAADLDGDGLVDVVALNYGDKTISLFKNIGAVGTLNASSFATPVTIADAGGPYEVAIADLDGDGKPDLIVGNSDNGTTAIFQNATTPGTLSSNSFLPYFEMATGSGASSLAIADLDGDGKLDVVVCAVQSDYFSVFRNVSTGGVLSANSFAPHVDFGMPGWSHTPAVADFNGDGKPDLAGVGELPSDLGIFQNVSSPGSFTSSSFAPRVDFGTGWNPWGIAAGDLDGDGRADIVFANQYDSNIEIYQNTSAFGSASGNSPPCVPAPAGLIGWWKSDGTALDQIGGNNGTLVNCGYTNGPVGEAFSFDPENYSYGTYTGVQIADKPAYALTNSLTIEGWIRPRGDGYAIFFRGDHTPGMDPYWVSMDGGHNLSFYITDAGANVVGVHANIAYGSWIHFAGTLDNATSMMRLYTNGVLAAAQETGVRPFAQLDPNQSPGIGIGNLNDGGNTFPFVGDIDEISLYNRALSQSEVQSIVAAGSAGKCVDSVPPVSLVVNGSFENPAGIYPYQVFSTESSLPGWTVENGTVEITAGTYWQAAEGAQSLDLNGIFESIGTIYQDIPTVPGQTYKLRFAYAGNPECGSPTLKTANVFWNGSLVTNLSFDITGHSNFNMGWTYYQQFLVATGTTTRIRFQATSPTFCGLTLDDVSVVPVSYNGAAPLITQQPTDQSILSGGNVTFGVAAIGSAPLTYQWRLNGTNISGATDATLTVSNATSASAGNYSVVVANYYDSVISSNALLTVMTPPKIISQTPSQIVLVGNPATFGVNATGDAPLTYFWTRNNSLISGATNSTYVLANAQLADSGSKFSCLVSNTWGTALSSNMNLKVLDTISNDLCSGPVVITGRDYTNQQSTLKASSFGDPVPTCVDGFGHGVWYQFTAPISGILNVDTLGSDFDTGLAVYSGACDALSEIACDDDTLGVTSQISIPTVAGTTYYILAGGYDSDAGNLVLHAHHLTPPEFVVQPNDLAILIHSNATFAPTVLGAQPISYQWYFNDLPLADDGRIVGATNVSLNISNLLASDDGNYQLIASNFLGMATSAVVHLTVLIPPQITLNPIGRSVPPGLPTTFNAIATGVPAPVFQWQLNGTNILGATGASLTVSAVTSNKLGFYHLVATNLVGVATSQEAQLTFGPVAAWGGNVNNESLPPPGLSNVVGIAGAQGASFAIKTDGRLQAWGVAPATNIPAAATNVISMAAFGTGVITLRADGTALTWNAPVVPANLNSNLVAVTLGNNFGIGLRAEGTLVGWGTQPFSTIPAGLLNVKAVASGNAHTVALRADGTVTAWGSGPATNVPANLSGVVAIAAGYLHSLALKSNGTVVAWGQGASTNLPAGVTNIVAVSACSSPSIGGGAKSYNLAIRANGTVISWGDNTSGETLPPSALSNLPTVAVNAAPQHGLALVNDGSPQIIQPPVGLTAYLGRDVSLNAMAVGAAPLNYQWLINGTNIDGATNANLLLPNIQLTDAGGYQLLVSNALGTAISLAAPVNVISNRNLTFLASNYISARTVYQGGTVKFTSGAVLGNGPLRYQWFFAPTNNRPYSVVSGATNESLLLDPALAMQSGYYYVAVSNLLAGVTSAATPVTIQFAKAWGFFNSTPATNVPNVTNGIAVATGGPGSSPNGHFLALGADGKVTAWGNYFTTSIGVQNETNVSLVTNAFITAIAANYQHDLALKSDGTVVAWGSGGATSPPVGLSGVTAISAGLYHDLALKGDGTMAGWFNPSGLVASFNYGQATNHFAATNLVAIAAGNLHSLALRADGTVVGWGNGTDVGTTPSAATNVIAIAAGAGFNLALRANGTVLQWGSGITSYPVPANLSNVVAISASGSHATALKNDGTVVTWGYQYVGFASNNLPTDLTNVIGIASGGEHDIALFGTRAPVFTVQPWGRNVTWQNLSQLQLGTVYSVSNILLAGKCAGVQPMSYQWRFNGTNIPNATNDTLALRYGPQTNSILPGTYQLVASNSYGVAISKPAKISVNVSLPTALDTAYDSRFFPPVPLFNWLTSGNASWFGETNITHDGVDAARSGAVGPLQETILQTTVVSNFPTIAQFWWKVSSEQYFDTLEFRVNGTLQGSISGEVDWTQASFPIPAGTNILQWRYSKDYSFDSGLDAGFVDQFTLGPSAPIILFSPANVVTAAGSTVTLSVAASGVPQLRYLWNKDGSPVGGNAPTLTLANVSSAAEGSYSVTVTNIGGATTSQSAFVRVVTPQILGAPQLLPGGALQLTASAGVSLTEDDLPNFEAQASSDLQTWETLPDALSITNGVLLLNDPARTNYSTRFYRILEH